MTDKPRAKRNQKFQHKGGDWTRFRKFDPAPPEVDFHLSSQGEQGQAAGFVVLPKRWVVERTHAWNERWRRLVVHHARKTSISAAWVWLAETRILLNRIASAS